MTDALIQRAEILIQQQKYSEAQQVLKDLLSSDPHDVHVLALFAEVNIQLGKLEEADIAINSAIGISPDIAYLYFVKARILIQQEKYDEAERYLRLAIETDPAEAEYYALLASIKLNRKQYEEALQLADHALALDPENILGLNIRSNSLLKLNKKEEAFITIDGALREDPNNSYTHANYGWNLLESGNHKKALEHFKEALKNDPTNQFAQAGMAEALKANNFLYRLFLKYAFTLSNLAEKYQWGFIIGFAVLSRSLRALAASNEGLQAYLNPIIILLAIIAFSTWVIEPVSNLFLRFNKYGKFLLTKNQIHSSTFVGISFLICILGGLSYFIFQNEAFLSIVIFGFVMMVPCGMMFTESKIKNGFLIYSIIMAVVGISSISIAFNDGVLFNGMSMLFLLGFMAFQWVANYLIIKKSNR